MARIDHAHRLALASTPFGETRLAIIAGIDEAGYGPLLGPLVVTGVAFSVPEADSESSLWTLLGTSLSRRVDSKDHRLPVLDSKKLYSSKAGLTALERTALVMLKASGRAPVSSFRALLRLVSNGAAEDLAAYPWYSGFDERLPVRCSEGDIATRANAVSRDLDARGVRLTAVRCEPILTASYNRLVGSVRNKAVVALGVVLRIVQQIIEPAGGTQVIIHVDRQGGRMRYRDALMTSFPQHHLHVLEEGEARSDYRLTRDGAAHRLTFMTDGEDHCLAIALASIYSKYVRELFMRALNEFWGRQVPGLKPTAGYYTDGCRFLRDIRGAVDALGIDRSRLVRAR